MSESEIDKIFDEIDNNRINLKKYFYIRLEKLMNKFPITQTETIIKIKTREFNEVLRKVGQGFYTTKDDIDKVLKDIKKIRRILNILM